jgi:hypothetical protein
MLEVRHFSPAVCDEYREAGDRLLVEPLRQATDLFATLGVNAISNRWHAESAWKRALAVPVYGDLLRPDAPRRRVLEVGGGLSAITLGLAKQHDYSLVELATHEAERDYRVVEDHIGKRFLTCRDWAGLADVGPQDIVIANDLFPNVDQRLEQFLAEYLPRAAEMRVTLTYYENTAWQVRRVTSGETLTIRPWGLREVTAVLDCLAAEFGPYDRSQLVYEDYEGRLFTNRRNIFFCRLRRDA